MSEEKLKDMDSPPEPGSDTAVDLIQKLCDDVSVPLFELDMLLYSSPIICSFLEALTDRQFQMMSEAMKDPVSRDQFGEMIKLMAKIVTKASVKMLLPKVAEVLKTSLNEGLETQSSDIISVRPLVETMMSFLGFQSMEQLILDEKASESLKAAEQQLDDLFLEHSTNKVIHDFAGMVHHVMECRLIVSKSTAPSQQLKKEWSIAQKFLHDFVEESVMFLIRFCFKPQLSYDSTEDLATMVMPLSATVESFEISRNPLEVYVDTVEILRKVTVREVMITLSKVPEACSSESVFETSSCSFVSITVAALHHCVKTILVKLQLASQTELYGSSVLNLTREDIRFFFNSILEKLEDFSNFMVEDKKHPKELHDDIIKKICKELLQTLGSESELIEAVQDQSSWFVDNLAVSIVSVIQNTDSDDLYAAATSNTEPVYYGTKPPLPRNVITKIQAARWANITPPFTAPPTEEESSECPAELDDKDLSEFSSTNILNGDLIDTFVELLEQLKEERSWNLACSSRDSTLVEDCMKSRAGNPGSQEPTSAADEMTSSVQRNQKRRFQLKLPTIFQRNCKRVKRGRHDEQKPETRRCSPDADMTSSTISDPKQDKSRTNSMFRRILSAFHMCCGFQ